MIETLNFPAAKMAQTWCYKLCCGRAGQSKDKASGPLHFQGAILHIMYQVFVMLKKRTQF